MKYAKAISPDRRNATGRVNSPKRRSGPPIDSIMPAMPGSDVIGAVPPPGMIAAGNAISLAVPTCVNRKAATILRMLSRYGARVPQRADARVGTDLGVVQRVVPVGEGAARGMGGE